MAKKATCGAKTRQGHPCKQPAGYGTDHLGSGRCKFHGGASKGAPKQNRNSEKHGLFSKYLPEESFHIVQEIEKQSPLDLLWDSILIQWAAIIRAQKLMYVKDREEVSYNMDSIQHAWDKQEQFLNAQSRAIATLGAQIERYEKQCRSPLATEEQRQRIEKLKMEVESLKGDQDSLQKLDEILEGINRVAAEQ